MPLYEYRDGVLKPVIPIRVIRQEAPAPVLDCVLRQPVANPDTPIADGDENTLLVNNFVAVGGKAYTFVIDPEQGDFIEI